MFGFFFFPAAISVVYTLSLHDALPISRPQLRWLRRPGYRRRGTVSVHHNKAGSLPRPEEHTSELQSRRELVCRLPPEKKNHVDRQGNAAAGDTASGGSTRL